MKLAYQFFNLGSKDCITNITLLFITGLYWSDANCDKWRSSLTAKLLVQVYGRRARTLVLGRCKNDIT